MKALVLCGGIPQIALIKELKKRGIETLLADMNPKVPARQYADEFFPVSVLDVDAIKNLASEQKVDMVITVCADQVLEVVAQVSEELGLPCYIDYQTAKNVSKKSIMKTVMRDNGIPTSNFVILDRFDSNSIKHLKYPLIVKPIDSYSSRGVKKVENEDELEAAFNRALNISRAKKVIVEEFNIGNEITVDVYVEEGKAHILCVTDLYKIGEDGKFVINRSFFPADITPEIFEQIRVNVQRIADAFNLKNTPMLVQLISNGKNIRVVEFCARTGGGIKFLMIKKHTGFDVVKAVVDLTLGEKPHIENLETDKNFTLNEFVYCKEGTFDHLEGFEELFSEGIISEYSQFKASGTVFGEINSSGDRVAYFSIVSDSMQDVRDKHRIANSKIKAISVSGEDLIRHDLIAKY